MSSNESYSNFPRTILFPLSCTLHPASIVFSLLKDYDDPKDIEEETLQDALHYEKYCGEQAAQGTPVTFKTAINAQSLYLVR